MSGLATLLLDSGIKVSGSDLKASAVLERLRALGARIEVGHNAQYLGAATVVAYSSAISPSNPELVKAQELGLKILSRADLLVSLAEGSDVVAVAGTHGKTTTTSMAALGLSAAGLDPAYIIGGELNEAGSSARWGSSGIFVIEADESDGTFLRLRPKVGVVTNIEADHLEHYGSIDALKAAFKDFLVSSALPPVVCVDDAGVREVVGEMEVASYGTSDDAVYQIRNLALAPHLTTFELFRSSRRLGQVDLPIPGIHNARNATAALVAALSLGAEFGAVAESLRRFVGVLRRFQHKKSIRGVDFVDDYAHLPAEIRATLQSARQISPRRVVAVFQPHRYSRTKELHRELGEALAGADVVVVTEVYPAGEEAIPGVSGELVYQGALGIRGDGVTYEPHRSDLARMVADILRPGDLCVSMGAGDITLLESEIAELWAEDVSPEDP